jgi:hypothetical protein
LYACDQPAAEAEGDPERIAWNRRREESLAWLHGSRKHHRREIAHWQLLLEVACAGGMRTADQQERK